MPARPARPAVRPAPPTALQKPTWGGTESKATDMARTGLTAAVNAVKFALMTPAEFANTNLKKTFYLRMKRMLKDAKKGDLVHRGAILCSHCAIDHKLRERSRAWLLSI